ncbi:uncharacterized protein BT62DRAFT_503920 [Guyanagaster necrorhizus]|uniref:Uncharacterized protein n=1 Tax=Guyanagaster necrorhizus TaxID=856835 RepID=A0A9P7W050_9AGAR|nr:uncharacterized protein BT62DRAFT_503920 [Guyanagaster necrorhizus MCA 3950]KAG7450313.1 hypothetical protein BT62DRAFT_503920 [Guyanagaster necrorhizus MCA 3950]
MSVVLEQVQRPRLVNDLIPVILENSSDWWPQDLLSLSIVSFSWLHAIRKRLYAIPVLLSYRSCALLAETLERNDHLLGLVKGIDIRPLRTGWPESGRPSTKQMASIRFILSLEGLECVTLGGELAVSAHRYLNAMSHPQCVRRLCIDGTLRKESLHSPPSLEWDEVLAFKFAALESLKLSNLDLDILFPSIPYPLRVTSLFLDTVRITNGRLIHLLHETCSLTQLWVTTERSDDFHEQIRPMLDFHPIEDLHYEMQCDDPLPFDLSSFQSPIHISLSRLSLIDTPVCPATLQSIEQCFPTLEKLVVTGRSSRVTAEEWAMFVSSTTLSTLRELGLPNGTNYPPFQRWSSLTEIPVRKESSLRGIHLSFSG